MLCKEVETRRVMLLHTIASNLLRLRDEEIVCLDDSVSLLLDCKTCQ